jgi:Flp pilus assembly pilin Flp
MLRLPFVHYSKSAKPTRCGVLKTGTRPITAKKKNEEDTGMDKITGMFVKVREYHRGQTMTEYALILSAVAVVVFVGYQAMGTAIGTLLTSVDGKL